MVLHFQYVSNSNENLQLYIEHEMCSTSNNRSEILSYYASSMKMVIIVDY